MRYQRQEELQEEQAIINLLQLQPGESITAVIPVDVKNIKRRRFIFLWLRRKEL